MRSSPSLVAAAVLAASVFGPALASGTARIQQTNGSVNTYSGMRLQILPHSVVLRSPDGQDEVSMLCESGGDGISVCRPQAFYFQRGAKAYSIPLRQGTVYINTSDDAQTLPLSSTRVPPHSILLALQTRRGTYITGQASAGGAR
jgi:hypothetical protein